MRECMGRRSHSLLRYKAPNPLRACSRSIIQCKRIFFMLFVHEAGSKKIQFRWSNRKTDPKSSLTRGDRGEVCNLDSQKVCLVLWISTLV